MTEKSLENLLMENERVSLVFSLMVLSRVEACSAVLCTSGSVSETFGGKSKCTSANFDVSEAVAASDANREFMRIMRRLVSWNPCLEDAARVVKKDFKKTETS